MQIDFVPFKQRNISDKKRKDAKYRDSRIEFLYAEEKHLAPLITTLQVFYFLSSSGDYIPFYKYA